MGGYPIHLKSGNLIRINAALVAYVANNPAAHQAIGLKESESADSVMQTMMPCKMDFENARVRNSRYILDAG